jgi:hypothetical protein
LTPVSIQSVSFWQQDQSFWQTAQAQSQASSADAALINVMSQAETNLGKGLASIANGEALTRTNSQLSAAVQSALQGSTASSTSSSSSSSSSSAGASSSSPAPIAPKPASGTGTVPVTTTTTLSSLGILPGGTSTIGDGTNVTTYRSTGSDTIGDLINAINNGSAFLTASINSSSKLVITARNLKEPVVIGGGGIDPTAIGFGNGNNTFEPPPATPAKASSTSTSASASGTSSSTASAPTTSASTTSSKGAVQTIASLNAGSAESILSASGISGNLVDMLA